MTRVVPIRLVTVLAMLGGMVSAVGDSGVVEIKVYPTVRRTIVGEGELDRQRYFGMCDPGTGFDHRMSPGGVTPYLLDELNATFGRRLSPIAAATGGPDSIKEDPRRPGFTDIDSVLALCVRRRDPNEGLSERLGGRLDVAAHGLSREYPKFLGVFTTPEAERDAGRHPHHLPENLDAAAEFAAAALDRGYSSFDRPAYYEPINEPHWSFVGTEHLAAWHTKALNAVRERGLTVRVGGPCLPVAYFYRNRYGAFEGFKRFLANTDASLDFYSFHVYDYLNWNGSDLTGRVTSGLPIEGVLDLVQSHAIQSYGKEIDLVVSEHGGYINDSEGKYDSEALGKLLVSDAVDGEDEFTKIIRQRSVASHVLVSAAIANTLVFMEHPHVLKKAVPFILPESMGWDPKYYPTMYVPHGFTDRSRWVETRNTDFYKFFRDLEGQRVYVRSEDPDLQTQAFVDGSVVRLVINNLSDTQHRVRLKMPAAKAASLRRYARGPDYTPSIREVVNEPGESLKIAPREAIMFIADYESRIPVRKIVDERPFYGRLAANQSKEDAPRFVVEVPEPGGVVYAQLRIGVTLPTGSDPTVMVRLNGNWLEIPKEDSASRLDDGRKEYASTKLVAVEPGALRKNNRVDISFPGAVNGAVGSVVIRVGRQEPVPDRPTVASRP